MKQKHDQTMFNQHQNEKKDSKTVLKRKKNKIEAKFVENVFY